MNLYTPADGLFGTHVTWADVEEDVQNALDTDAFFGPNKCAKNIGEGNVSFFFISNLTSSASYLNYCTDREISTF